MRLALMASGGGSNVQAILDAVEAGTLGAEPVLCLSTRPDAGALERATRHDVATRVIDPAAFTHDDAFAEALLEAFGEHEVTHVALAGFLRKIPSEVVRYFENRMLNIHPSLLPAFGGKGMYGQRVHEAVLAYGVRWTGVTVHFVDEAYDTGPILLQQPVRIEPADTPQTLAARVLKVEHRLYPQALSLVAEGRVTLDGRRVHILPSSS